MAGISILTDTDSNLPIELAAQYRIYQAPMTIHFGKDSYQATYELSDAGFFQRIEEEGKIQSTAAPSPGIFISAHEYAFVDRADQLPCIYVSGEISATHTVAMAPSQSFLRRDRTVIDSHSLSMGLDYIVLIAAEAASLTLT